AALSAGLAEGATLPAGTTPAPESGAGDETGDGCAPGAGEAGDAAALGAGAVSPVCCFISSRRKLLSCVLRWAYRIDSTKVSRKKIPASQPVNFTSTFVV